MSINLIINKKLIKKIHIKGYQLKKQKKKQKRSRAWYARPMHLAHFEKGPCLRALLYFIWK
jgi:hypothetical protein